MTAPVRAVDDLAALARAARIIRAALARRRAADVRPDDEAVRPG